jgi:hypothetical protein
MIHLDQPTSLSANEDRAGFVSGPLVGDVALHATQMANDGGSMVAQGMHGLGSLAFRLAG